MRTLRINLIAAFMGVLFLSWGTASGRSGFYIGFGASSGHYYSSHHHSYYPYYGSHGGYYDWLDHGRYSWIDQGRYYGGSYYPSWYSRSSGTSVYIESRSPIYVTAPVVESRRVVVDSRVIVEPKRYEYKSAYDPANEKLVVKVRQKKAKLLKVLKIGEKGSRIKAISELAGYSFDDKVRKALEEIILTHADADLRRHVAESLGKVKNMSLIPVLEKVRVEDADLQVRMEADKAIKKIKAY